MNWELLDNFLLEVSFTLAIVQKYYAVLDLSIIAIVQNVKREITLLSSARNCAAP